MSASRLGQQQCLGCGQRCVMALGMLSLRPAKLHGLLLVAECHWRACLFRCDATATTSAVTAPAVEQWLNWAG